VSKVALVTGVAPGSLGQATADALREHGFRVLTTTRRCPVGADTHPLELTSRDSVATLAAWLHETTRRLDVLVNNAGIHLDLRSTWSAPQLVEGDEVHWRTNYLGTAHLTRLALPLMLDTARTVGEARVVNVVSKLHERGRNEGLDGHLTPYDSWAAYGTSKLALVHEAAEIERRFGDRGVHGYALHPGALSTNIADRGLETAPLLQKMRKLLAPFERRALGSPQAGARTVLFCATSPEAQAGGYHRGGKPAAPSTEALDEEAARLLWEATDKWVASP